MVDARQILDILMGAPQQRQGAGGGGDLADVLGQILGGGGQGMPRGQGGAPGGQGMPQGGGLGDILGQVLGGGGGDPRGRGAPDQGYPPQGGGGGGLGDILGQVLGGGQAPGPHGRGGPDDAYPPQGGGGGGLGDILGQVLGGGQAPGPRGRGAPDDPHQPQGGGLGDILGQILGGAAGGPAGRPAPGDQGAPGGGLGDILGQVLGGGQAPRGQAVPGGQPAPQGGGGGAGDLGDILGQIVAGAPPAQRADILARIRDFIAQNPGLAAGTAGGLGALVLGTQTGRQIAKNAAMLGGLAVIGALAYRAYNDWQNGSPPARSGQAALQAPPAGSGFGGGGDPAEQNNTALIMIKAMIASAAADGRIDEAERAKMVGSIKQMNLDAQGMDFVQYELAHPGKAADLADYATTPEMAAQIYTAARMVVEVDTRAEKVFLAELAERMGLDAELVAHIEAAAAGMAA